MALYGSLEIRFSIKINELFNSINFENGLICMIFTYKSIKYSISYTVCTTVIYVILVP